MESKKDIKTLLKAIMFGAFIVLNFHGAAIADDKFVASYMVGENLNNGCRDYLNLRKNNMNTSSPKQAFNASMCYNYVIGIIDTFSMRRYNFSGEALLVPPFCIPENTNAHSITEVVARYLDEHPEKRTQSGYALTRRALAEKFPC